MDAPPPASGPAAATKAKRSYGSPRSAVAVAAELGVGGCVLRDGSVDVVARFTGPGGEVAGRAGEPCPPVGDASVAGSWVTVGAVASPLLDESPGRCAQRCRVRRRARRRADGCSEAGSRLQGPEGARSRCGPSGSPGCTLAVPRSPLPCGTAMQRRGCGRGELGAPHRSARHAVADRENQPSRRCGVAACTTRPLLVGLGSAVGMGAGLGAPLAHVLACCSPHALSMT